MLAKSLDSTVRVATFVSDTRINLYDYKSIFYCTCTKILGLDLGLEAWPFLSLRKKKERN